MKVAAELKMDQRGGWFVSLRLAMFLTTENHIPAAIKPQTAPSAISKLAGSVIGAASLSSIGAIYASRAAVQVYCAGGQTPPL